MKSLELKEDPSFEMASYGPIFPTFYVSDEQMPEITDWDVEGEYTLTVKVRVKNKTQAATVDGVDTDSVLEVLAYEIP